MNLFNRLVQIKEGSLSQRRAKRLRKQAKKINNKIKGTGPSWEHLNKSKKSSKLSNKAYLINRNLYKRDIDNKNRGPRRNRLLIQHRIKYTGYDPN